MWISALVAFSVLVLPPHPSPADSLVIHQIRQEALERSQVMTYAFALSERFGPRMTGTPAFRAAGEWAMKELRALGLDTVGAEPIDWGRGWEATHVSVTLQDPRPMTLIAAAVPWSPSTPGPVEGTAIRAHLPEWETPAAYRSFFETWRGRLDGHVLLVTGPARTAPVEHLELPPSRLDDAALAARIRRFEANARPTASEASEAEPSDPELFTSAEFFAWQDSLYAFLQAEGVVATLYGAGVRGGTVHLNGPMRLQPAWLRRPHQVLPPASFVVAPEHYDRLLRLVEAEIPARIRLDLEATFFNEPSFAFNVIGDRRGTERPGEVVMIGAHLDAWPLATGATDNAAGVAVVMEAMRILQTLDLPLARTVRVALWGGHEGEGLGSRTYVQRHYDAGYPPTWLEQDEEGYDPRPLAAYDSLFAYFNLDYLAGRIRGLFLQESEAARPIFASWLAPFEDVGGHHLATLVAGGSDHMAFHDVGLPAFPFIQDGPSHNVSTHHSNMDLFEYLDERDLKQSAMILAAVLYQAAMSETSLP